MKRPIKKILIRVNGNKKIGLGHVFQSLALAKALKGQKREIVFVTIKNNKNFSSLFEDYKTIFLPNCSFIESIKLTDGIISDFSPEIFILNITDPDPYKKYKNSHYFLDWVFNLRKKGIFVVGIEGIATKGYYPDVIINGTIVKEWHNYKKYKDTKYFIGPKFMVLREIFGRFHKKEKKIKKKCKKILVSFGGGYSEEIFPKILTALSSLNFRGKISLIVGPAYENSLKLTSSFKKFSNLNIYHNPSERKLSELILGADLAVTSAGNILYELASLGLPSVAIPTIKHQVYTAHAFQKYGVHINTGFNPPISKLTSNIGTLLIDYQKRKKMSVLAKKIVDGRGLERVKKIILKLN